MIKFNDFVVRSVDGGIDLQATTDKFQAELLAWEAEKGAADALIVNTLNAIFDQYKGANLNQEYLIGEYVRRNNVRDKDQHALVTKRVKDHLKENTGILYLARVGKGGGFKRMCDA